MMFNELVIFSTLSSKEALMEIVPAFEHETGCKVRITYSGGSVLSKQLVSGSEGDLFIGPQEFSELLASNGVLRDNSCIEFARSSTGLAVRADAVKPDLSSTEQVKRLLLDARSVSYSPGASGIYLVKILERFGMAEVIAAKCVPPGPGEMVGDVVARGAAEVGVQQISELLPVAGIQILDLPPEFRQTISYGTSAFSQSSQHEAGRAFLDYLRSDAAGAILRAKGLQPIAAAASAN